MRKKIKNHTHDLRLEINERYVVLLIFHYYHLVIRKNQNS